MKKKVYFVQIGANFGNSYYLPYGVGTIVANCLKHPEISSEYQFPEIIFTRDKLDFALSRITDPYIAAFSCNVWNTQYNKALAKRVKEKYPECIIAFGGHSVGTNDAFLRNEDYIDVLFFGEGEETFAELLKKLPEGKIDEVHSIAYRNNGEIIKTPQGCVGDLSTFPSPFTSGVFDSIVKHYPDFEFNTVLETNRGCPYSCAYCDWTHGKRMRLFPIEKIQAEILWIAENKVPYIWCGDSNFGLFERDLEIVDMLVDAKKKYGNPQFFRVNNEKNSIDRVFQICKKLNEVNMDKGATISYQSLNPEVLKNIGRKNLDLDHFSELIKKYNDAGIKVYSEFILGLPGETYESFRRGICTLIANGQHSSIYIYMCEILPNSPLADPEYMKKHEIQQIVVPYQISHTRPKEDEVSEYSYLIGSTKTMDKNDWAMSNLFSYCIQGYHIFPLLRLFAIFLFAEKIADYYDFYSGLIDFLLASDSNLGRVWRDIKTRHDNCLKDGRNYYNPKMGDLQWQFEEAVFLETVMDFDNSMKELTRYMAQFDVPVDIFEDLIKYQTAMLRKPFEEKHSVELRYDFSTYFDDVYSNEYRPLKKIKNKIIITPARVFDDVFEYARDILWYGKRKEATVYKKDEIEIAYE
ncbi:MAG: B12-binding domain-containing radical SAM protein [Clostridia bacterium]|nr:B12-binding domain-containing radical SAM protein [Clostridia bacterium]